MLKIFTILLGSLLLMTAAPMGNSKAAELDPENTLLLDLEDGQVTIKLMPDIAPNHVERIKIFNT